MADSFTKTETVMWDNGTKIKPKVLASFPTSKDILMKVTGQKTVNKVTELRLGLLTIQNMKGTSIKVRSKVKAGMNGQMAATTMAILKMVNLTELVHTILQI